MNSLAIREDEEEAMRMEMLDGACRRIDLAIRLLDEARKGCRSGSVECKMIEDVLWSLFEARIKLAILKNRASSRMKLRVARASE